MHVSSEVPYLKLPFLGISVTPMTDLETAVWASSVFGKKLLLNHNLHSAYLFQQDPDFRALYARADRTVVDGMPILLMASLASRHKIPSRYRIGSTDWIARLAAVASPGRLFLYGATDESNLSAVQSLRRDLEETGWTVDGVNGYMSAEQAIRRMHDYSPTLVLVGMGMPMQERFLMKHWDELPNAVYATVGGAIDYVGGRVALSPRWMGSLGLEWMWRFAHSPRRLAHRYFVEPLLLLAALATNRRKRTTPHPRRDEVPRS